ncbi:MAG: sulfotransferase domain-containing protein [Flavobacteriales bacterium]|nr:sulfotransferase domain-containing protein [Flavobacteriales bacterium]
MTTKRKVGVFINRLRIFLTGANLDRRLFFVTGRSKCGTTWLGRMLSSHILIHCDINENNLTHQDKKVTFFNDDEFFLHSQAQTFYHERENNLIKSAAQKKLIYDCPKPTAITFGDKTPRQHIPTLTKIFPKAPIIFMVRDPRDMIVSLAFHNKKLSPNEVGEFSEYETDKVDFRFVQNHILNYKTHDDLMTAIRAKETGCNVLVIRYEDLKTNCEKTLANCFKHLGVRSPTFYTRYIVKKNSFKSYTKGRSAGQQDEKSFYRKGIIGDWKNHLTAESRAFIENELGEEMRQMGYL